MQKIAEWNAQQRQAKCYKGGFKKPETPATGGGRGGRTRRGRRRRSHDFGG